MSVTIQSSIASSVAQKLGLTMFQFLLSVLSIVLLFSPIVRSVDDRRADKLIRLKYVIKRGTLVDVIQKEFVPE